MSETNSEGTMISVSSQTDPVTVTDNLNVETSMFDGKLSNGQKTGRGKLVDKNQNQFIEGEWVNDRLVKLYSAQFQLNDTDYTRLNGLDLLYSSNKNNFVARIVLPSFNIDCEQFCNIRKEIESNIIITKIFDDDLKNNLEYSREKFEIALQLKRQNVTISKIAQRDMFHLSLIFKNMPKNHSEEHQNIMMLNKISNNEFISQELKNAARKLCQDEQSFTDRNRNLFVMNQVEMKFSWMKVISECIDISLANIRAGLMKALPSRVFVSSAHEDINKLQHHQLFTCSVHDIQLFADLELTTKQHAKTFELGISNFQDFTKDYISKLWTLLITKINKSELNNIPDKSTYTNLVFLQLFKSFFELLNSVCTERNEEITKIIDVNADADLSIAKNKKGLADVYENRLKFLISLMNHFKPGDLKTNTFKYNFSFLKMNETIFKRLTGFIVNCFDNSLTNIPQESVIWLYYIHKCFSDVYCQEESKQNDSNRHELFSFINFLMNLFKTVIEEQEVSLEKLRILANSLIKFGTTISPYFLEQETVNEDEMTILLNQAQFMKNYVIANQHAFDDITNFVDIYQVFWDERKNLLMELKTKYSCCPSAGEEFIKKLNTFTQYIFNLKSINSKFLMFLRSYNEFIRLLRGTDFPWYVKKEDLCSETFVKLVDTNTNSYLVEDTEQFVKEYSDSGKDLPRHLLFDLSVDLLSCVEEFLQRRTWAAGAGGAELLLLMGRSLIDFNKLPCAVDFQHFYALFTEPFRRLTNSSSDLQDFQRRLASLETYYKYTLELNVMSVAKALQLCEQNITDNSSLLDYSFNSEQLKLSYNMYEKKFKNYIDKYILQPDFDIKKFVEKVRTNTKLIDISKWNSEYKILELPKLVAGLSAVWSALESKDVICLKQVVKPHCIQILCVLRLLGADQARAGFDSHLAQVLTGQGKSLVLALLAAALALTGNRVRIVCYNQYLANRDQNDFFMFYRTFNIEHQIKYDTFENMANEVLKPTIKGTYYDLRTFVSKLVTGELPRLFVKEEENAVSKTVLLVDEVDVFFSPEFYGNTLNPIARIKSETMADMQIKIWNLTEKNNDLSDIEINIQKYIDETFSESTDETFVKIVKNSRNILNSHVKKMISNAVSVRNSSSGSWYSRTFKLCDDGLIISVENSGEHRTTTYYSYNNVFMYFKLKETNFDHKNFHNYGYLNVDCGNVSYAMLPQDYRAILGVTGTLKQLSDVELRAVNSYHISRGSDMPTFFGASRLRISNFTVKATEAEWTRAILDSILCVVEQGRAVIVFFVDEHTIDTARGAFSRHLSRYSVLTGNEAEGEVAACVEEAGVARRVTVATRRMGRGVDFQSNDSAVEAKGGVHVIQTFFSDDVKEETQIKSRTARKDNSGSYEAILCRGHLAEAGYEDEECNSYEELNAARARRTEARGIELAQNIENSQKIHDATMEFLRSFYDFNPDNRQNYFKKYPFVDL